MLKKNQLNLPSLKTDTLNFFSSITNFQVLKYKLIYIIEFLLTKSINKI